MIRKFECLLYVLLTLGWFLGCQILMAAVLRFFWQDETLVLSFYETHLYKINGIAQIICLLGIITVNLLKKKNIFENYRPIKAAGYMRYVFWGLVLWGLSAFNNRLLSRFFIDYERQIYAYFSNNETILRGVVLIILAPFLEEYLFREKIQGYLKEGFNVWVAIVIQGILFGMIHSLAMQKIYATFLGIALGLVREREGNIQSSTVMHMTINLISFVLATG